MWAKDIPALPTLRQDASRALHALLDAGLADIGKLYQEGIQIRHLDASSKILWLSIADKKLLYKRRQNGAGPGSTPEGLFYQIAWRVPQFAPMRVVVPQLHYYDEQSGAIILDFVGDGRSIHYDALHALISPDILLAIGKALSKCHTVHRFDQIGDLPSMGIAPTPWVLRGSAIRQHVPANNGRSRSFIDFVSNSVFFQRAGESVLVNWQATHLMHGDLRLSNLIEESSSCVIVLDWELAGWGNPLFDLGSLLASLIFTVDLRPENLTHIGLLRGEELFEVILRGYAADAPIAISPAHLALIYTIGSLRMTQYVIEALQLGVQEHSSLEQHSIRIAEYLYAKSLSNRPSGAA